MASQQYGGGDVRFPQMPFDPKAVTRASWEPKPIKPKQDGPLMQFNRHPDAHEVIVGQRRQVEMMSRRTKTVIKAVRVLQLVLRVLQLAGAAGVLVLMIIISNVSDLTVWVMRITAIVVMVHSVYGIYHMAKPAGARTPASSAAYQVFSAFSDLCILPMYAYGLLSVRDNSGNWSTLLANKAVVTHLKTGFNYTLLGAGGLHLVTIVVACWLAIKFRQITLMPPDMNPLEDNLTSRTKTALLHTRNKSSVVTMGSLQSSLDLYKDKDLVRPPAVPFAHTRGASDAASVRTYGSRDSRIDLPSRQYQAMPTSDSSARSSTTTLKRASMAAGTIGRGAYAEISLHESYSPHHSSRHSIATPTISGSAPGTAAGDGKANGAAAAAGAAAAPRQTRFKENWHPSSSDSVGSRTQQQNQALNTLVLNASGKRRDYNPVNQNFDFPDSDGEVSDTDTVYHRPAVDGYGDGDDDDQNGSRRYENFRIGTNVLAQMNGSSSSSSSSSNKHDNDDDDADLHPSPLRSNPMKRTQGSVTPTVSSMTSAVSSSTSGSTAENGPVLGELNGNERRASVGVGVGGGGGGGGGKPQTSDPGDLGDGMYEKHSSSRPGPDETDAAGRTLTRQATGKKRWTWAPRNRDSSIQAEDSFYSKPYGNLKASTPPVMVGKDLSSQPAGRQVSSGNDYDLGSGFYNAAEEGDGRTGVFGRRHVSGKLAEEGRAYARFSQE